MYDVAIIGAGLAGITCGQYLQQQGQKVVFLEKSRGLGGRMATRRLHSTIADHGARFFTSQGTQTKELVATLMAKGVVTPWQGMNNCYVAPLGMSAIAKHLATDLDIRLNHKVTKIMPTNQGWSIFSDTSAPNDSQVLIASPIQAKALVMAIPAPQALALLSSLGSLDENSLDQDYLAQLAGVKYDACITVIAGYAPEFQQALQTIIPSGQAVTFVEEPILAWLGIDSSKRTQPPQPVVVLHSTSNFAAQYLESTDLNSLGLELLNYASTHLLPELKSPQWFQVHRWCYAQPKTYLNASCFSAATPFPLVCCGDWCQTNSTDNLSGGFLEGNFLENALASGLAAAQCLKNFWF